MLDYPPTIIIRDRHENPKKCTVLPLRGRSDMQFLTYPLRQLPDLHGYIRLAVEGDELSQCDAKSGILVLDASWRWAIPMNETFADVPPRALRGFVTAYPRRSKRGTDPETGLATVEALYIAYQILGRPTEGLLDHYRWAEEFLRLNGWA